MNIRIGKISKWIDPSYGACGCCKTTWLFVPFHETKISPAGDTVFCLCEKCWRELETPEMRLPFYLYASLRWMWDRGGDSIWPLIWAAVMGGG